MRFTFERFMDSNADGIGDFPGLMSKLDYLQDLGVTCLWLLPFFPSPLRDDGYDIANYVDVNPSYGTINDFKQFLDAAHLRNMQVMIELVINHTSDQHPWFKAARLAPKGSPERRYVRLERYRQALRGRSHYLYRHREIQLDLGRCRAAVLLASLLLSSARPELRQPARDGGSSHRDAVLAGHGRGRSTPGRDPLSDRARRYKLRERARDSRQNQTDSRRDRRRV